MFSFRHFAVFFLVASATANLADRRRERAFKRFEQAIQNTELKDKTKDKLEAGKRLNLRERREVRNVEKNNYLKQRAAGQDEVSNTAEAARLRAYRLRSKKRKGLIRKREASLAEVLFPGVAPNEYAFNEDISIYTDLVDSRKTPIPFEYYDLPFCPPPVETAYKKQKRERRNLGNRLQGYEKKVAPFTMIHVKEDRGCTPLCTVVLSPRKLRWLRQMIQRQYRVQLTLDQLPVLMRSKEYNYAIRGYPIGFQAPKNYEMLEADQFYLFNHLKFTITYYEGEEVSGVHITGFDVHPMSVSHDVGDNSGDVNERSNLPTCAGEPVLNDPESYLALRFSKTTTASLAVTYSYEVEWKSSDLPWADRWDVYLVGAPDDDLHYFSIVNSLMIVLFLTGAISTIMIRTLRKDIAVYNELDSLDDAAEETGWKLVHGDVFRPPTTAPMLLSVLVGTGCQIGLAFALSMLAAMARLLNPVKKGHTLTAMIVLYVFCGSVAGYVSSRIYKFTDGKAWKMNILMTAIGLPGCLVLVFTVLNVFLSIAGAATAVSILTILFLFFLWVCVSAPLVMIGAFFGLKADKYDCPVKTNQIARVVPPMPFYVDPKFTVLMGGLLPFGSVCIELAFIMSALWLHQIYYVMGFLLAVLFILTATCAQVSIVLAYLQLCCENHRWWWWSFWNCASGGLYLFAYSIWFLTSRLEMVGFLPVIVYLAYMGMISIIFGIFCGSIGFLASFWFTRTIYAAVKVD